MKISSFLYKAARLSRDLNAARRGPRAMVKRMERKALGRLAGRIINKMVGR